MHISDYTRYFHTPDELAEFCLLEVDAQNAILDSLVDAGKLKAEKACKLQEIQEARCAATQTPPSTVKPKLYYLRFWRNVLATISMRKSSGRGMASWPRSAIKLIALMIWRKRGTALTRKER